MRRHNVDEAEERNKWHTRDPHGDLFPPRHRLKEAHFGAVINTREMLLAVGMSDELIDETQTAHSDLID